MNHSHANHLRNNFVDHGTAQRSAGFCQIGPRSCQQFDHLEHPSVARTAIHKVRRGSICDFCSIWGAQDTHMLEKAARKASLSHAFCVPQVLVKSRT